MAARAAVVVVVVALQQQQQVAAAVACTEVAAVAVVVDMRSQWTTGMLLLVVVLLLCGLRMGLAVWYWQGSGAAAVAAAPVALAACNTASRRPVACTLAACRPGSHLGACPPHPVLTLCWHAGASAAAALVGTGQEPGEAGSTLALEEEEVRAQAGVAGAGRMAAACQCRGSLTGVEAAAMGGTGLAGICRVWGRIRV